ncbi:MAG TPA: tetratricopeptide repeat protein [Pyrinomonadaceae bacterium]|nr:tetratricopeptide repeat protein [Pyrinomonadaceae bacterium]
MLKKCPPILFLILLVSFAASAQTTQSNLTSNPKSARASADSDKIPVTSSSEEAKKEFLMGRDLAEKLLIQDSIQHYDKAIALDANFAAAELNRANSSPTAKEFFEHLNKAVALSDKASAGERLQILAAEAGANGNVAKQKEYLEQLVTQYPNDERAHFALGGYYFGQQDFTNAIEHYKKATILNPNYSTAFNILGYAYRQAGDYANAESAFKKYILLIPNDPNPYDSYAELLLKMGRFDEAVTQYQKAVSVDRNFINSHQGIASALMYQGKHAAALAELDKITAKARSDGERRTAMFARTVVYVDSGQMDKALAEVDNQYALGEKTGDIPGMAGDLQLKGNILLEMGRYDEALDQFSRALKMTEDSNLSEPIKNNTRRFNHYNRTRVALGKKDVATAKAEAQEFWKLAEASNNPNQLKLAHELGVLIALDEKNYDQAISEFEQSNMQNPQDLYRLGLAYQAKGNRAKAQEYYAKAAQFNSLPIVNLAFVRAKAAKLAAAKS